MFWFTVWARERCCVTVETWKVERSLQGQLIFAAVEVPHWPGEAIAPTWNPPGTRLEPGGLLTTTHILPLEERVLVQRMKILQC